MQDLYTIGLFQSVNTTSHSDNVDFEKQNDSISNLFLNQAE